MTQENKKTENCKLNRHWKNFIYFFTFVFFQLVLPEYLIHVFFCVMFLCAAEWLTLFLNLPLLAYHVWRFVTDPTTALLLGELK